VVSCPWEVEPGGPAPQDAAAADWLRETISALDWDRIAEALSGQNYAPGVQGLFTVPKP
jgi:hypothetical protein